MTTGVLPLNLFLVRHGRSEGNVANRRDRKGDDSLKNEAFLSRLSKDWRLTPKGCLQANAAGEWLREWRSKEEALGRVYPWRHCVSNYVRTMETAAHLGIADPQWVVDYDLRERNMGELDVMKESEKRRRYKKSCALRDMDALLWTPPNGESVIMLKTTRVNRVLGTLARECSDMSVVLVTHCETMWAFRVALEKMLPDRYETLRNSKDSKDKIHNCQVLHYTRIDPRTQEVHRRYEWMRSLYPFDLTRSRNDWQPIERKKLSNEELLAIVERTPRLEHIADD